MHKYLVCVYVCVCWKFYRQMMSMLSSKVTLVQVVMLRAGVRLNRRVCSACCCNATLMRALLIRPSVVVLMLGLPYTKCVMCGWH